MLALVGLGLGPRDISVKALEFLKSADAIMLESYTSIIDNESIQFVATQTKKTLIGTKRGDFEENLKATVAGAKKKRIAILVTGDPLIATTHHIILDECSKQGVDALVFHAPSIFSSLIGESGLDIYKFGPTTTIPYWSEHYKPVSFIHSIRKNLDNKQHTIVLFDINQAQGRPMAIGEAYEILKAAIAQTQQNVLMKASVLVMADMGRNTQKIFYVKLGSIGALSERLHGAVISMIFPSELNFAEEESLKRIASPSST